MSLRVGALLAALVAGPPLWALVSSGQIDGTTALTRVTLVALASAVGVALIGRIVQNYHAQAKAAAEAALAVSERARQDSLVAQDSLVGDV
jgi:hypothetical protein